VESLAANKSKEVQEKLKSLVELQGTAVNHISAFGYKFDSAFWIVVQTDSDRNRLISDRNLLGNLNVVFEECGYLQIIAAIWDEEIRNPELANLQKPTVVIESQETIDRNYDGNWYQAMK